METLSRLTLAERITPHLRGLIRNGSAAIAGQFKKVESAASDKFVDDDPLGEEARFSPLKGIVHKFPNRILCKVSYRCAAHCQFCTRARQIGNPDGDLSGDEINRVLDYVAEHTEVDDVILSGGDPLVTPQVTIKIIDGLTKIKAVKMIRIGTRLPIHSPTSLRSRSVEKLLDKITDVVKNQPIIMLIHLNHPDELTAESIDAIKVLKSTGVILMTQTVFLNGINDDVKVLAELFTSVYHLGIIPYYIFHCDSVIGLERFIVPIEKEREIVTELRKTLSGIAVPTYAIDVPGRGKIDVPLSFWANGDLSSCTDYDGNTIDLTVL